MKKLFAFVLSAFVLSVSAQDIMFSNSGEDMFTSQIPLNELKSLEPTIDDNGDAIVTVRSRNGAVYTTKGTNLKATTTQIEDILSTGRFATMERVKTFDKIDELELGDFVGVFNEDDYNIEEFLNNACSEYASMSSIIMKLILKEDSAFAAVLAYNNNTTIGNIRIHVADIVYVGKDVNGQKIPLSARLIYPYNIMDNNLKLSKIYIDNHPTVFIKDTEPTRTFNGYSPCSVCARGYLVVQPDLLGFGASYDRTQQYIDLELNGSAIAYSVVAAQQFQQWSQTREEYGFRLLPSASIINAGASQGATSALSGTYYMENVLDKEKYSIPSISETKICAGAYDMVLSMDEFCNADSVVYASKLPMLIAGAITAYPEKFGQYTLADYFTPEVMDYVYTDPETKEVCGTIWQMLDLKSYSSTVIGDALYEACPSENSSFPSFHKMMNRDLFNEDGTLDWTNEKMKAIKSFCDDVNFCSTERWTPKSPIQMVHGNNDTIVPYSVSEEFFNNQMVKNDDGSDNISFITLNNVPEMGYGAYGTHLVTCIEWYLAEITGMPIKAISLLFSNN